MKKSDYHLFKRHFGKLLDLLKGIEAVVVTDARYREFHYIVAPHPIDEAGLRISAGFDIAVEVEEPVFLFQVGWHPEAPEFVTFRTLDTPQGHSAQEIAARNDTRKRRPIGYRNTKNADPESDIYRAEDIDLLLSAIDRCVAAHCAAGRSNEAERSNSLRGESQCDQDPAGAVQAEVDQAELDRAELDRAGRLGDRNPAAGRYAAGSRMGHANLLETLIDPRTGRVRWSNRIGVAVHSLLDLQAVEPYSPAANLGGLSPIDISGTWSDQICYAD